MLHLITATPGSGKTFWAVSEILRLAQAGESVYTNITDCTVPSIQPLPEDFDIESLPDGSHVFIDEAQKINKFQAVGRQPLSSDPTVKFFEVHRHRAFEIYFITQDPEFLHKHILKLIGHHVFLVRPMGSRFPAVYEWSKYQNRPDSRSAQKSADAHYQISFKKSVYNYYKSTVQDTHKFQWAKLLKLAALPIIAAIFIVYTLFFGDNHFLNTHAMTDAQAMADGKPLQHTGAAGSTAQPTSTPINPPQPTQYELESKRVSFISRSDTYCRAFDGNGNLMLDIQLPECQYLSDNPIALRASTNKQPAQISQPQQPTQQTTQNNYDYMQPAAQHVDVRGEPLPSA